MFGQNPKLPPEKGDGSILKVHSIFPTIQGEGPYSGRPAVFIRLSGCNLACSFCDTEFDAFKEMPIQEVLEKVNEYSNSKIKLVVITGGEPFRQKIGALCESLVNQGFKIQIESNGTLYQQIPDEVEIVCSPKNTGSGYSNIRSDVLKHTIAVKFIISESQSEYNDVAEVGQCAVIPVYIQPMDEYDEAKNAANSLLAQKIAFEKSAIFSIQLHKILKIA